MRFQDITSMVLKSIVMGGFISIVLIFATDKIAKMIQENMAISVVSICILTLPISYIWTALQSHCRSCKKNWVVSESGQDTISNYVEYQTKTVSENGISYKKQYPVNCRRYIQYYKCDNCGSVTQSEKIDKDHSNMF